MSSILWLDEYERKARLAPGLFALLPVVAAAVALGLRRDPFVVAILSALVAVGGPIPLAKYVRNRGLARQAKLFQKWGGPPTTLLLTPAVAGSPNPLQEQRRWHVERIANQQLPTNTAPLSADEASRYDAATAVLRAATYDAEKYSHVAAEVRDYGHERNTLGIRPEGRLVSAVCVLGLVTALLLRDRWHIKAARSDILLGVVACVLLCGYWLFWPSESRVRAAGFRYAERLLDAASQVES